MSVPDLDHELRAPAMDRVRELQRAFDDLIPVAALKEGFRLAHRLLRQVDGPMLRSGLQGFHGAEILQPRRRYERPDAERLEVRFEQFRGAA